MLKISFWLKKPENTQSSLEHITISSPQRVLDGKLAGCDYACEFYLSDRIDRKEMFSIYAANPVDALYYAVNSARVYLQNRVVKHGYKISETENGESWKEAWKLEIGEPELIFQERIKRIKEAKDIPPEGKKKILEAMKESFGKLPHMKDKFD